MVGRTTQRREIGPITWGILRNEKMHLACASEDEILLTWMGFRGPSHDDASEPCVRCGRALSETPDP